MTDDFTLSRRKALAALGTIGAASAGAGLGTSAYFSDQETFENNRLVAGTLDMKIDWEEHYSDWSTDETQADGGTVATRMEPPTAETPGSWMAFPIGSTSPDVWVRTDDSVGTDGDSSITTYMDNTSVEAYPDTDDDGIQDAATTICGPDSDLADVPDDRDPTAAGSLRTLSNQSTAARGAATFDDVDDGDGTGPLPLLHLEDIKPGDYGEVTFSFHLCDNPGFVWLTGVLEEARENGTTESESDDPDENGATDEVLTDIANIDASDIELLDEIRVAVWYDDDCDNLQQRGADPEGLVTGGTLAEFLADAAAGDGIPLTGDIAASEGGGMGRNCYSAESRHCIGFSWWLPVDHANEIQTDSVSFDLGFYTEQCRHNDQTVDTACEPCSFDTTSPTDSEVSVLSTDDSAFPDLSTFVRVDTTAGNAGDLVSEDFALCEGGCDQDVTATFDTGDRQADIVFVFDDTGSMFEEIDDLQNNITSFINDVESAGIDARYALISFKDVVETDLDFTTSASDVQSAVNALSASGGGDGPEDNLDALGVATRNLTPDSGPALSSYRSGAQRIIIDITDATGHEEGDGSGFTNYTQGDIEGFLSGYTYYAVSPTDPWGTEVDKRDIANNLSNGTWLELSSSGANLDTVLTDLVEDITAPTYRLDYTTPNTTTTGSPRTVEVRVDDPTGTLYGEGTYTP
ncbi:MAG: vWA domain-containing protein [Haloplanus sp.]